MTRNRITWYSASIELGRYEEEETRKLSYRKDDRAMRHMYGCPEKFRESLTTPMATFLEIFNGHLFRLSRMQNLKFVALPVPEIIGVPDKIGVPGYAHAPFSPKILLGFCSDGPSECTGQICSS